MDLPERTPGAVALDPVQDSGVGIHIGASRPNAAIVRDRTALMVDGAASLILIPPAVLVPRLRGERALFSDSLPLPVRGSGLAWPPSAALDADGHAARAPLAWAWESLSSDSKDPWSFRPADQEPQTIAAADAVACAVKSLLAEQVATDHSGQACLVIPNDLSEGAQQAILDSSYVHDIDLLFLWRPVAAALEWCLRLPASAAQALIDGAQRKGDESTRLGRLLCVHLGLDGFECTSLDLVGTKSHGTWIQPARGKCRMRSRPELSKGLVDAVIRAALQVAGPEPDREDHWRALWCSPLLPAALTGNQGAPQHLDQQYQALGFSPELPAAFCEQLQGALLYVTGRSSTDSTGQLQVIRQELSEWTDAVRSEIAERQTTAVVVSGELAAAGLESDTCLGRALLDDLGCDTSGFILIEGTPELPHGALARGAAVFLDRRARGEPTYLDTLPRMESVVLVSGEPTWVDLLTQEDQYVDGGRTWIREPDFGPVEVRGGEERLDLDVWMESDDAVHGVSYALPVTPEQPVPASLRVSMHPARGNARIELVPREPKALGRRRIYLDWTTARRRKETREELLETIARPFPPLEPRAAHRGMWQGADPSLLHQRSPAALMTRVVNLGITQVNGNEAVLDPLRKAFVARNVAGDPFFTRPQGRLIRAVSSDGQLAAAVLGSQILEGLIAQVEKFLSGGNRLDPNLAAILGYCSADGPGIRALLAKLSAGVWQQRGIPRNFHLTFLGNCLRCLDSIQAFSERLLRDLRADEHALKEKELKALALVLMYRDDALRNVDTTTCEGLFRQATIRFRHQLRELKLSFTARAALQCMAFLLRRRRYASDFLNPSSEPAKEAKQLLEDAIVLGPALKVIGGFVDIPRVMRTIMDYIDRRGVGRVSLIDD
ncbi:MAG: hypothetical protein HY812_21630 [Planctomycetes bacterium]|nr:hypothetical protein [Planctomycetota bacterium]